MTAIRTVSIGRTVPVLYLAFELGWNDWKLAFASGPTEAPRLRTIARRRTAALLVEISKAKQRFVLPSDALVVSCYEAGRRRPVSEAFMASKSLPTRSPGT